MMPIRSVPITLYQCCKSIELLSIEWQTLSAHQSKALEERLKTIQDVLEKIRNDSIECIQNDPFLFVADQMSETLLDSLHYRRNDITAPSVDPQYFFDQLFAIHKTLQNIIRIIDHRSRSKTHINGLFQDTSPTTTTNMTPTQKDGQNTPTVPM